MPSPRPSKRDDETRERVATSALIKVMGHWGLTQGETGELIGLSKSKISVLARGESNLALNSKAFELAVLILRGFRSLDALAGGDNALAKEWLRRPNKALHGIPIDLMKSVQGLVETVEYLDQRRAPL